MGKAILTLIFPTVCIVHIRIVLLYARQKVIVVADQLQV